MKKGWNWRRGNGGRDDYEFTRLEEDLILPPRTCCQIILSPQQTGPLAVGFALGGARILQHIIQNGGQRAQAVEACLKELRDPGRTYKV